VGKFAIETEVWGFETVTVPEIDGSEVIPTFPVTAGRLETPTLCPEAKETAAPNVGVAVVGFETVTVPEIDGSEVMPTLPVTAGRLETPMLCPEAIEAAAVSETGIEESVSPTI